MLWTGRYGLLHEDGHAREVFQNLHLNVATRLEGSAEHWRRTDDNGARTVLLRHVLNKVLEGLEHTRCLVRGNDEGVAFLLEYGSCTLDRRIDEGNYFETQTELTVMVFRWQSMWRQGGGLTARSGKSDSRVLHRILG